MTSGRAPSGAPRRRALVTGAAGFIGTALTRALLARDHAVTMLDLRLAPVEDPNARQEVVDVRDRDRIADLVGGHDVVFHLAANTENRPGLAGRWDDCDITVGGTVALLEALVADPPTVMVLTSTQLVYGSDAGSADELTTALRPATPFAAAKAAAEAFLCAYTERTGARGVACRLANVVGPGVPRGVVADLSARLCRDPQRLRVLGDGRQRRTYVHVDDCVSALLTAAEASGPGFAAFNVSNRDSIDVAEVARIIAGCCPDGAPEIEFAGGSAWQGDATVLHPDPGRLLALGWHLTHHSREAIWSAAHAMLGPVDSRPVADPAEPSRRQP